MNLPNNILQQIKHEQARRSMSEFVRHTKPDYQFNWHHLLLCSYLDRFIKGDIQKLAVFMPPQHGKSELVSRKLPAYILGKYPTKKIVGASYSSDLSSAFNRDVQRGIDSEEYRELFPDTLLNGSNVKNAAAGSYLRNADIFEIVKHRGFYKSVGVGGSLTGTPADISIIDDPVKDAMDAYSQRVRDNVWEWYVSVLKTRLHNDSQQLLTMTRWHEDDLAGRLLALENDWTVLMLPAIKVDDLNKEDPRQIGEALWPNRHSLQRLYEAKELSQKTFSSLYQQSPISEGGNIIKSEWLEVIDFEPANNSPVLFVADTAYTAKTSNDATGIIAFKIINNDIYILNVYNLRLEFPQLCDKIKEVWTENGANVMSRFYVEPKASGKSIVQQLRAISGINIIEDKAPESDKITRLHAVSSVFETKRVKIKKALWNDLFIHQLTSFPNGQHDDLVDCAIMAIDKLVNKILQPQIQLHRRR
jgi:predicted phage terminase large subunit-like protein